MIIGVPKEIKPQEHRVGMVPATVHELVQDKHSVLIEAGAGLGAGIPDAEFAEAGAKMVDTAKRLYGDSEMIVKVKEPLAAEYGLLKKDQVVFTYFHLAADRALTDAMIETGAHCFAYETLEVGRSLPLLTPMSEVAGRMSIQVGANCLEAHHGGRGILLGGVPGTKPSTVLVLGGGVVGTNAAWMAAGMGARVVMMDINLDRLRYLEDVMPKNVTTIYSNPLAIREQLAMADQVIGAVLDSGARAPVLVSRADLALMKSDGPVVVDVAVDQGGCIEKCKPPNHPDPTYVVHGVLHDSVANMPGAVPRTSTFALTNATGPYVRKLARAGAAQAVQDPALRSAANVMGGKLTLGAVGEAFDMPTVEPESVF